VVERVALAGRAARRHAVAAGADQPVDLRRDQLEINLPSRVNGVVMAVSRLSSHFHDRLASCIPVSALFRPADRT